MALRICVRAGACMRNLAEGIAERGVTLGERRARRHHHMLCGQQRLRLAPRTKVEEVEGGREGGSKGINSATGEIAGDGNARDGRERTGWLAGSMPSSMTSRA